MRPNVQPLVRGRNKPSVMSLREIAAGKVHYDMPSHEMIQRWIDDQARTYG